MEMLIQDISSLAHGRIEEKRRDSRSKKFWGENWEESHALWCSRQLPFCSQEPLETTISLKSFGEERKKSNEWTIMNIMRRNLPAKPYKLEKWFAAICQFSPFFSPGKKELYPVFPTFKYNCQLCVKCVTNVHHEADRLWATNQWKWFGFRN